MLSRFALLFALAAVGCSAHVAAVRPAAPAPVLAAAMPPSDAGLERTALQPDPAPAQMDKLGDATPRLGEAALVDDEGEDEPDDEDHAPASAGTKKHAPALALDDATFAERLKSDAASLGPMSVGRPSAGMLVNGVQLGEDPAWRLVDPGRAWGTQETVDAIARAIHRVSERLPGASPLAIGHISARHGGPLSPHKSHQAGRDADIGYYYTTNAGWFARATAQNLDRARTWELIKAFIDDDAAEMIFVDTTVQRMLRDYALAHGEDKAYVDRVLQVGSTSRWTIVRHIPGHATHIHVRFNSPMAVELGARAEPIYRAEIQRSVLAARARAAAEARGASRSKAAPASDKKINYVEHRVHSGETLYWIAQHYGVSVQTIQEVNGLKGAALKPKMVLRIPKP